MDFEVKIAYLTSRHGGRGYEAEARRGMSAEVVFYSRGTITMAGTHDVLVRSAHAKYTRSD
jgi:D-aminopeptidase